MPKDDWKYEPYSKWHMYAVDALLFITTMILLIGGAYVLFGTGGE